MTNSNRKGKEGELELCRELRSFGFWARRSVQYSGANGDADVIGVPGVHIECKRYKKIRPSDMIRFRAQAVKDAQPGELPAVFYREDYSEWYVTYPDDQHPAGWQVMTLADWVEWYREVYL